MEPFATEAAMALPVFSLALAPILTGLLLGGGEVLKLSEVAKGGPTLSEVLKARHSTRAFSPGGPSLAQVSALLWAAQGTNRKDGKRTVFSAGAAYPLELYFVTEGSSELPRGTYRYLPRNHELQRHGERGVAEAFKDGVPQNWVRSAPSVVVVAAVLSRTSARYGERAPRYVHMEAGAAAQSLALQAAALGLGSGVVGAFDDAAVKGSLGLPPGEEALLLLPVGNPRE